MPLTYLHGHLASVAADIEDTLVLYPFFRDTRKTLVTNIGILVEASLGVVALVVAWMNIVQGLP